MSAEIIATALELLKNKAISNYAIARATGISKPTIAKYRIGKTKPNELYAEKIVNYITNIDKSNTGATQTDNNIINPKNAQAMDASLAMDYIATLKGQLAKKDEQIDALIQRLPAKDLQCEQNVKEQSE